MRWEVECLACVSIMAQDQTINVESGSPRSVPKQWNMRGPKSGARHLTTQWRHTEIEPPSSLHLLSRQFRRSSACNICSINSVTGSPASECESHAVTLPEAILPALVALNIKRSFSLMLEPQLFKVSVDPVLDGGRVLRLAYGAAAAARCELAEADIVLETRISGSAQAERRGRWRRAH
jgi:hypothetical protein